MFIVSLPSAQFFLAEYVGVVWYDPLVVGVF